MKDGFLKAPPVLSRIPPPSRELYLAVVSRTLDLTVTQLPFSQMLLLNLGPRRMECEAGPGTGAQLGYRRRGCLLAAPLPSGCSGSLSVAGCAAHIFTLQLWLHSPAFPKTD